MMSAELKDSFWLLLSASYSFLYTGNECLSGKPELYPISVKQGGRFCTEKQLPGRFLSFVSREGPQPSLNSNLEPLWQSLSLPYSSWFHLYETQTTWGYRKKQTQPQFFLYLWGGICGIHATASCLYHWKFYKVVISVLCSHSPINTEDLSDRCVGFSLTNQASKSFCIRLGVPQLNSDIIYLEIVSDPPDWGHSP